MKKTVSLFYLFVISLFFISNIYADANYNFLPLKEAKKCSVLNKSAAVKDSGKNYFLLAMCKVGNIHVVESYNVVLNLLYKSAKKNFPLAYFALGELYYAKYRCGHVCYGVKGKPIDVILAIKNYEKAARYGSSAAEYNLGELYLYKDSPYILDVSVYDVGKKQLPISLPDYKKAIFWLTKAAKHGNADAQKNLGYVFAKGIGGAPDHLQSYLWYSLFVNNILLFHGEVSVQAYVDNVKCRDYEYTMIMNGKTKLTYKLLRKYMQNYLKAPSNLDLSCERVRKLMS